ncbi:uncharacterized protein LOC110190738 [Drosophila serrata]|uniref:uncharacterized protein LOC110190738 n=1 Tax=Drosophila serrata TaxID=7274 RepID=UPI000A1D1C1D|nr:uncharacterized protein LOC110190738 [Drosophila serrata]
MWKLLVFGLWITLPKMGLSHVAFTNLKCNSYNPEYLVFPTCQIKAVNRTHKYISIYSEFFELPISTAWVSLKLLRFDNGYKPFFFDISYDGCKFLKDRTKNPLANLFYKTIANNTNLNHTCPYTHNVILEKLWTGNLEKDFGHYVPLPNGDYAIYTEWTIDGALRASIKVYMKLN